MDSLEIHPGVVVTVEVVDFESDAGVTIVPDVKVTVPPEVLNEVIPNVLTFPKDSQT